MPENAFKISNTGLIEENITENIQTGDAEIHPLLASNSININIFKTPN